MGSQIGTFFIIFWCYQEVQKQDRWVWHWYKSKHWGVKMYTAVVQSFFWAEDRKVRTRVCSCVCVFRPLWWWVRCCVKGEHTFSLVPRRSLTPRETECGASGSCCPQPLPFLSWDIAHHWGLSSWERESVNKKATQTHLPDQDEGADFSIISWSEHYTNPFPFQRLQV